METFLIVLQMLWSAEASGGFFVTGEEVPVGSCDKKNGWHESKSEMTFFPVKRLQEPESRSKLITLCGSAADSSLQSAASEEKLVLLTL